MALFQISLFSEALRRENMVSVVLPDVRVRDPKRKIYEIKEKFPTLYLFHGAGGNHLDWIRYTNAEHLADEYQIALIMPAMDLGFYTDMYMGSKYFTYISEELPAYLQQVFPLSKKRKDCFLAGLSMGGYGAMKVAMTYPERFEAVASMSGVLDAARLMKNRELTEEIELDRVLTWCFGTEEIADNKINSLEKLMSKNIAEKKELPRIYQCVGTEDFLYDINQNFYHTAEKLGVPICYEEGPGMHEWGYWRQQLPIVFAWMFGADQDAKSGL